MAASDVLLGVGGDWLLYRGPPVDGGAHRHHALQLAIALGEPLRLCDPGQAGVLADGWLVDADTPHRLLGGSPRIALLYLEPESRRAAALRRTRRLDGASRQSLPADPALRDRLANFHADEDLEVIVADWLSTLGIHDEPGQATTDPRVQQVIARLRAQLHRRHSAADLARSVGLSAHRLMHLFRAGTGLPLRRYALWLRLRAALAVALRGATLTEAAHAAGFSDSAHLSRTFREHFGLPPRFLFEHRDRLTVRFR